MEQLKMGLCAVFNRLSFFFMSQLWKNVQTTYKRFSLEIVIDQ